MAETTGDLDAKEIVGENVRRFRQLKGLTQEQLAHQTSKHRTYIGSIERGERNVTVEVLFDLADGLDVDPRDLLTPPDEFDYP